MADSDDGPDCDELHNLPNLTDICGFVRNTSSCSVDEGFFNYNIFLYCSLGDVVIQVACLLLFVWWLFLITGVATTADEFFCPALAVISQSLKLSHNMAGVTFLAFGNGAPDIFSAIAAMRNVKAGDAGLAIGGLFGGGVFVTAVVTGAIAIVKPFTSMQRPFLRDVIFYLGATFWAWFVTYDKKITQAEAAGFIVLYIVYVIVVLVGRYINQKRKKKQAGSTMRSVRDQSFTESQDTNMFTITTALPALETETQESEFTIECLELELIPSKPKSSNQYQAFLQDINPIDQEVWKKAGIIRKIYECFKSPLVLCLKLTIPVVGKDNPDDPEDQRNWNRLLNSLHLFTGPVFAILATKLGLNTIEDIFPVYGLVMIICFVLAIIVFMTSKSNKRPVYHTGFAYLAFVVAVVWISTFANEIVNILKAFGIVFNLSDAILGLTLLSWGNGIGDLVADTSLARQGYPRMAVSACFGGPLFNLLIGIGIPFTIACLKNDGVFYLKVNIQEMVLATGLGCSLLASLIIVPASGFKMSRPYGIFLMILYLAFLVVAILTETNVIENSDL